MAPDPTAESPTNRRRSGKLVKLPEGEEDCRIFLQRYNSETKSWGSKMAVKNPKNATTASSPNMRLVLPLGGELEVFPNYVPLDTAESCVSELVQYPYFRQHCIQGNDEPRAHCLLHEDVHEEDFEDTQPGYGYGSIRLKARPLAELPRVQELSDKVKETCGVSKWKVGINPVVYRDGKDHIGLHADNNQGETIIFTAVLKTRGRGRRVRVVPKHNKKEGFQHGAIRYELWLRSGDAYKMDGMCFS